jgi:hypothetical protein
LENIGAEEDINRAWETTGDNINISAKESLMNWRSISHGTRKEVQNY